MVRPYKTSLPLWYIIGIFVTILLSLFTYLGSKFVAISLQDIGLLIKLQFMNWLVVFLWLAVNIYMLVNVCIKKVSKFDFVPPIYFVVLYLFFAIVIILGRFFDIYFRAQLLLAIGVVSTIVEIILGAYLLVLFFKNADDASQKVMRRIEKEVRRQTARKKIKNKSEKVKVTRSATVKTQSKKKKVSKASSQKKRTKTSKK